MNLFKAAQDAGAERAAGVGRRVPNAVGCSKVRPGSGARSVSRPRIYATEIVVVLQVASVSTTMYLDFGSVGSAR